MFQANYCRHRNTQYDRDTASEKFCLDCGKDFSFDDLLSERRALFHLLERILKEIYQEGILPLNEIKEILKWEQPNDLAKTI